jgi:hypothetical protein
MTRFKKDWRVAQGARPASLQKAYFLRDAKDPNRMIGISLWESKASCERYMASTGETKRKKAMSPHVLEVEWERFFDVTEVPAPDRRS